MNHSENRIGPAIQASSAPTAHATSAAATKVQSDRSVVRAKRGAVRWMIHAAQSGSTTLPAP
jgi:hypothetical protein